MKNKNKLPFSNRLSHCAFYAGLVLAIFMLFFSSCKQPYHVMENKIQKIEPESNLICILQGARYDILKYSSFDIAIIDPDDSRLSKTDIESLQSQGKKLFSYLSIGEAENYRYYWYEEWKTGKPDFLEKENSNWKGNYKVKYWDRKWQIIVFDMLFKIINKGYDGVYLDVVDAYKYFESLGYENVRPQMIDFVDSISKYAKSINDDFLIVSQNAEELIDHKKYFEAIDGAGRENLWFLNDAPQDEDELTVSLAYLDRIKASGKFVFIINYCSESKNIQKFKELAKKHGFIPFVGTKELDYNQKYPVD